MNAPADYLKKPFPTLAYIDHGDAGQVREFDWEWKLSAKVAAFCTEEFKGPWYSLVKRVDGWYIVAHIGCVWDYATGWIDFDWLKEASLGHDILHWLIKRGVLPTAANDAIDDELALIAKVRGNAEGWRQWYLSKATNLCDQKTDGKGREVKYLYGNRGAY